VSTTARPGRLDPDRLAELEEQRDHLLASLRDLEREHDAGDLDDHDYGELKDDYTARAAEVIRAIDEHRDLLEQSRPERNRGRTVLVVVSVLAVAVLAGFLLARSSGQRGSGTITGNDDTLRQRLASCQMTSFQKPAEGIDCYSDILDEHPDNLEALTYQGFRASDNQQLVPIRQIELAREKALAHERAAAAETHGVGASTFRTPAALVLFAWACVGIPLAWGIWITLQKAVVLFH